jgi:hypothetical protein
MRVFCSILALSVALAAAPAIAQDAAEMSARLQAAQAAGIAQASQAGDEALTCDQLQAEITATMSDPAVRTQIDRMGATAQDQRSRIADAQSHMAGQMAGQMGMGVITSVISSFIPGAGLAQSLAMRAQAQSQMAQGQQSQAATMSMAANMEAIMPQMMRGQRIMQLAQAQHCAFLQGMPQN